jgi:hypothetical protein
VDASEQRTLLNVLQVVDGEARDHEIEPRGFSERLDPLLDDGYAPRSAISRG